MSLLLLYQASVTVTGTLNATEAPDTAHFIDTSPTYTYGPLLLLALLSITTTGASASGTLVAQEGSDSASFQGSVLGAGSGILVAQEGPDTALFPGTITGVAGRLVAIEGIDTALINGTVPFTYVGILSAQEANDNALIVGSLAAVPVSASPYPSPYDYGWYRGHPWKNRRRGAR